MRERTGGRAGGKGAACQGSGGGDSSAAVFYSLPEAGATILGKARISRPRRKLGGLGWAGRVSRQAARAARPDSGSRPERGDSGRGQGARGRAPHSAPPTSGRPRPPSLPSPPAQGQSGRGGGPPRLRLRGEAGRHLAGQEVPQGASLEPLWDVVGKKMGLSGFSSRAEPAHLGVYSSEAGGHRYSVVASGFAKARVWRLRPQPLPSAPGACRTVGETGLDPCRLSASRGHLLRPMPSTCWPA